MSNFLAIATATATLRQLLAEAIAVDVNGAVITTVRPDGAKSGTPAVGVNLYLMQVTPNPHWRNADLPTRRPDGLSVLQRPQAALDLTYLLTFYGDETHLEPQRLLGSVTRTLHAQPILTRQRIRDTIANPAFDYLAQSDLADQAESIRFTPLPLTLEELSKLWSVLLQIEYTLSVTYHASVVLIEGNETPQEALTVRQPRLFGTPFRQPVIEQVSAGEGPGQPIVAGGTLVLAGQRLGGAGMAVLVGGAPVPATAISDTRVTVTLPAATVRAGVQGVQVAQTSPLGDPPEPRRGAESNVSAFVLSPVLSATALAALKDLGNALRSATVTATVSPPIGRSQRVVLLLNEFAATGHPPRAYSIKAPPFPVAAGQTPSAADTFATLAVPVTNIHSGTYLVRVQVDGAGSPLTLDDQGQFAKPQVTFA